MKNSHKLSFFLLLFFSLGTLIAQQKFNAKGQQTGVVILKFSTEQTSALDRAQRKSSENGKMQFNKQEGYVKTGIADIDKCNKKLKVYSMKRVFRHGGKFEEKHRKHGLHLWYEVTYDSSTTVNEAIDLYKKSNQIETAHARHKIEYADGYSGEYKTFKPLTNKSQSNTTKKSGFTGSPNDSEYSRQWHYHNTGQSGGTTGSDIDLEKAWDIEKGDSQVIVAVMDTPIQVDHPDLKRNMWINDGEIPGNGIDDDNNGYVDDINGYNFVQDTGDIKGTEHGTHVAGTIAAETNNGIGVAGIAGGSGNGDGVRIMSCAIINFGIEGLEESYVYAADHGAVISQNSWGLHRDSNPDWITATKAGIDYFIANAGGADKAMDGGLVIFAMGNDNHEYNDTYPDSYTPVFHVGATDHKDIKANFSNFGTWGEVFAPGKSVLSTLHNSEYGYLSGTSMAAPHTSGLAALLVSKHYGNITPNQVKALIQGGAEPIDELNPGYRGKLGAGRINAFNSLTATTDNIPMNIVLDDRTETSIKIKWNSISSANNYDIRYKTTGAPNWTIISDIATNTYLVQGLTKGTEYHFQVRSKGSQGISLYSERKIFWSYLNNPQVPKNVRVSEKRRNEAKLNWDEITNTSIYDVAYKKLEEQEWISFPPRGTQKIHIKGLLEGASYQIKVRAVYGDIFSEYSPVITFTTGAPVCNDFDPWDSNKVYPGTGFWDQGYLVAHNGNIYENNHWTQNQEPGVSSAWKKLETCNDGGNLPPMVNISHPNEGEIFEQEVLTSITLSANASDPDGTIDIIQFEANGSTLTQGNNILWTPTAFGNHTIKVTVTDDKGATATHQVSITIKQITDNLPPTVTISQPTEGQIFEQEVLTSITLSANASDPDGTINSIQFEVNGTALAQGNNISWTPTAFGSYTIKVTATDDKGATATHQISITVKETNTGGGCNGIPSWDPAVIYPSEGGVEVSYDNNIYKNKWWTQNNEPGAGGPWGPWELIGPCSSPLLASLTSQFENFSISPNPAQDILHIHITKKHQDLLKITLYDLTGEYQMELNTKNLKEGSNQVSYDISSLSKGLYLLKIERNHQYNTKKIIIN